MSLDSYQEGNVYHRKKVQITTDEDGPFQVLSKINDKAYKIELSSEYGVSVTFNVFDLSPFNVMMMSSIQG